MSDHNNDSVLTNKLSLFREKTEKLASDMNELEKYRSQSPCATEGQAIDTPSSVLLRSNDEWLDMFKEAVQMAEPLYSSAVGRPAYLTEIGAHESKLRAMVEKYISIFARRVQHALWLKEGMERPLREIQAHLSPLFWENLNDNEGQEGGPTEPRSLVDSFISAISEGDADSVNNVSGLETTYLSPEQLSGKANSSTQSVFNSQWTVKSKL